MISSCRAHSIEKLNVKKSQQSHVSTALEKDLALPIILLLLRGKMLRLDCVSIKNQPQSARAVLNPGCSDSAPAEYCVGGVCFTRGKATEGC